MRGSKRCGLAKRPNDAARLGCWGRMHAPVQLLAHAASTQQVQAGPQLPCQAPAQLRERRRLSRSSLRPREFFFPLL